MDFDSKELFYSKKEFRKAYDTTLQAGKLSLFNVYHMFLIFVCCFHFPDVLHNKAISFISHIQISPFGKYLKRENRSVVQPLQLLSVLKLCNGTLKKKYSTWADFQQDS